MPLIDRINANLDAIEEAYLIATANASFDSYGSILQLLLSIDKTFARRYLEPIASLGHDDYARTASHLERASYLWNREGSDIDSLFSHLTNWASDNLPLSTFDHVLNCSHGQSLNEIALARIESLMRTQGKQGLHISELSLAIADFAPQDKAALLTALISSAVEASQPIVGRLFLHKRSYSGGEGEGFVRDHKEEIQCIEEVKRRLPKNDKYADVLRQLDATINQIEITILNEEKEAFHFRSLPRRSRSDRS